MFYSYNDKSEIISKHQEEPQGERVAFSQENFDLTLYNVIISYIHRTGEILKYHKILKPVEIIEARIRSIEEKQTESELDIDFRLSMIELGLI